jgi:signal transduction histidine kinase
MHDGISQSLFSISLGLEVCRKQVNRDPYAVGLRLEELEDLLRASMGELRRYIYDLHPAKLQQLGLVGAIEYWVGESVPPDGPTTRIEERGRRVPLSAEVESCLYRVARESVSNALRHAQAESLQVLVIYQPTDVTLVVSDDGHGFDVGAAMYDSNAGSSVGLRSIAERVASAGGHVSIDSQPGRGCEVRVSMPTEEVVR